MIRLVKVDRAQQVNWLTLPLALCVSLFFGAIVAAYFIGQAYGVRVVPCVFRLVTGQPCFLCGGSRASFLLLSGQPVKAMAMNPLVAVGVPFAAVLLVVRVLFRGRVEIVGGRARAMFWLFLLGLVLVNWVYLIVVEQG